MGGGSVMKLIFNGVLERKSGGCNCRRQGSQYGFTSQKMYILPSGACQTFITGQVTEVSDSDAEFLLSYNGDREVFTKVED